MVTLVENTGYSSSHKFYLYSTETLCLHQLSLLVLTLKCQVGFVLLPFSHWFSLRIFHVVIFIGLLAVTCFVKMTQ